MSGPPAFDHAFAAHPQRRRHAAAGAPHRRCDPRSPHVCVCTA
eukprot:CAMPEP_0204187322 /NCGR_PEP_ID=MMETSP0361-20130328/56714_1 /ASSEMBLY_ACC=CAM_ASM_000343 /TAXON_ID=268821 /ORGANISM="Scrippsiella Hangoei, Strain SHTV-5" /LENGTH=42 /DNA_ID= /DNA_START= /DNA_END= /DNA_ORIENTATION=